jgi:hypothetical protein
LTTNRLIVDRWASGNSAGWQLYWRSTGTSIAFAIGSTILLQDSSATRVVANQWYHVAVTRSGTTARLFIDGTQVASATDSSSLTNSLPLSIGTQFSTSTNYLNGYVDELRITKGVARYISNFSVATVPFPNSATQSSSKYVGLIGGLNDLNVDYGIEKLSDTSLKVKKMSASGGGLPASVDRVYVNIKNYNNIGYVATSGTSGSSGAAGSSGTSGSSGNGAQLAKAWVNFNGTGAVAIRDSYNVSSITDNSVGDYTINYSIAFPSVNYCANVSVRNYSIIAASAGFISTTSIRVSIYTSSMVSDDSTHVFATIFSN